MIELNFTHPVITALGWTLVHFLWQGLVLGAAYALLVAGMRNASAVTRYWLGMGTLAAMLLAAIVTFGVVYQAPVTISSAGQWSSAAVSVQVVSVESSAWDSFLVSLESLLPWAVLAWLSGVCLLSGRIAFDFWHIRKLAIDGVRPLPEPWPAVVERLCESLAMPRLVRVLESVKVSVPMVIGWLRPVILIPPSALMGLTHKQLELIISHELAHVKRLDYLFNVLQLIVETLLFYHPLVRYVAAQVRIERENCCDDIVVARSGDTLAYARALTEVEGLRCSSGMQVVLAATGGHLAGRVRRLAGMPAPQRGAIQWVAVMMLVGASATAFTGARYAAERSAPEAPVAVPEVVAAPASVDVPVPETAPEAVVRSSGGERKPLAVEVTEMPPIEPLVEPVAETASQPREAPVKLAAIAPPASKKLAESHQTPVPARMPEPDVPP
ncbi:MAG: M56 family metallopeptidase, partial [Gammaproteobacteria bacterium]